MQDPKMQDERRPIYTASPLPEDRSYTPPVQEYPQANPYSLSHYPVAVQSMPVVQQVPALQNVKLAQESVNNERYARELAIPFDRDPTVRRKPKKTRYCCGCFASRAGCCCFWGFFILLIIIGLIVAGYFLWPRISSVDLTNASFDSGADPVQFKGNALTATGADPFTITLKLNVQVSVSSQSLVDYFVSQAIVTGTLLNDQGQQVPGANVTGEVDNVVIAKQTNTSISLPLQVLYQRTTSLSSLDKDQFLSLFITKCATRSALTLQITTTMTIPIISWTGYKPSVQKNMDVTCPVSVNQLFSSINSLLALAGAKN